MKQCFGCKKYKDLSDFSFKNKGKGIIHSRCKQCTREVIKKHYSKNKDYYLNKANLRNSGIRNEIYSYLRVFLSKNPCVDCGEKDITVLEFDHRSNSGKLKAVSQMIRHRLSLDKIKEEIGKCEVRCANCHRRKTAKDFKWYKFNLPL